MLTRKRLLTETLLSAQQGYFRKRDCGLSMVSRQQVGVTEGKAPIALELVIKQGCKSLKRM
jgi:hypothetical protein